LANRPEKLAQRSGARVAVILPDLSAGCSMADMADIEQVEIAWEALGEVIDMEDVTPVTYINSAASLKAFCGKHGGVVCTSSNAVKIVESLPENEKIIFAPDRNLGGYINKITGRNMVLWDGSCDVHNQLEAEKIVRLKIENPDAKLIAHPECQAPVLELADFVGSTSALLNFTAKDDSKRFIVATESGILHQMYKQNPEKEYIIVPSDETCACNDCPFMKKITMQKILDVLENETNEITLPDNVMKEALKPIERMLKLS